MIQSIQQNQINKAVPALANKIVHPKGNIAISSHESSANVTVAQVRTLAVIDHNNIACELRKLGWKLDFKKFYNWLSNPLDVSEARAFLGNVRGNHQYYNMLKYCGFDVCLQPTTTIAGRIKGNVDGNLVVNAMKEMGSIDSLVLVSGDGDFSSLAYEAHSLGKLKAIVCASMASVSRQLLMRYKNKIISLEYLKPILEYTGK